MAISKNRQSALTKAELYERALALVDAEGLDALSMRRLAADVGVSVASLYHHVPNKEALLDGALLRMREEIRFPEQFPEDWRDLYTLIFMEYRRIFASHPNMITLAGKKVESDPQDSGLVYLIQLGFAEEDAVDLWQSLMAFTLGFSVFSSQTAPIDTFDLPSNLAERMDRWDDETCERTLRMILESYEQVRTAGEKDQGPDAE